MRPDQLASLHLTAPAMVAAADQRKERPMKGYRTLALNLATAAIGVLIATDWTAITDPKTAGLIVTAVGVGNTVLRFFTTGPVGQKD
jgi:hypothetical protein